MSLAIRQGGAGIYPHLMPLATHFLPVMARTSSSDDSSSEDEIAARIKSVAVSAADISASAVASQEVRRWRVSFVSV